VFAAAVIATLFALKIKDMRHTAEGASLEEQSAVKKRVLFMIIACVLVIAAVCAFIWYESFVLYTSDKPYDFKAILGNQDYMFNYHSKLKTDKPHPFQSRWYSWPLDIRPVFLFQGEGYPDDYMSSLSTMGNPAVWWGAFGAVIALVVIRLRKGKLGKRTFFLGIAAASEFVPWIIISRETFIYHYFETLPFLILLAAVLAKYLIERTKHGKKAVFIYMGVCLLLFILFYPVTTGIVIPRSYANVIRWLPSWPFY
jgi:dolichyl-phosphate-mannose--protein O-mannosyl transferase